ncbi:MAG: helix-turn-helix domain-containing protein [Planctomycetes bacterium]|nr:helix-turn-helix domain-containing protein [Planctomycetota bacterium]
MSLPKDRPAVNKQDPRLNLSPYNNPMATRLTEEQKEEIVVLYKEGLSAPAIAPRFSVSNQTVNRVLNLKRVERRRYKLNEEQQEEIVRLYQEGKSVNAVAAIFSVSTNTVSSSLFRKGVYSLTKQQEIEIIKLHREGLSLRTIADKVSVQLQRVQGLLQRNGMSIITEEQKDEMVRLYKEGLSVGTIAPRFSVRRESVWNVLRRKGVKTRPRIEAVNKALTIHSFNAAFFDVIDTEEKAYWVGFIMADGWVYHKGSTDYHTFGIGLKASDKHHLLKLKDALNSSHPIYIDSRNLSRYRINSKRLCEALMKHGIVPRKSNKELVPPQMQNELLRHFWRGYFDGDGSLYITKNMNAKHRKSWGFTLLGSHTLLESFVDWILSQGLLVRRPTLHRVRPNSKTFEVKLRRESEVRSVTRVLYGGATVYLDRKMEKYLLLKSSEANDGQLNLPLLNTKTTK